MIANIITKPREVDVRWQRMVTLDLLVPGSVVLANRVSQKIQKSEFWNVTYPSGFHRLDEPPEKISAL